MFTVPNINIGRSNKSYTHDMSFDNNTTFDFGSVQPLMCHYMLPQSDIKVNYRQLVRLAPLVVPSFARLHLQTEVSYVPVTDLCPYYECLISKKPFNSGSRTYIPTQVPYTDNVTLVWYLLFLGCKFTVLVKNVDPLQASSYQYCNFAPSDFQTVYPKLTKAVFGTEASPYVNLSIDNLVKSKEAQDLITVDSADFVIEDTGGNLWLFRLSPAAKRFRKVLIGCGYSLNLSDSQPVSILPLLGFCKAYNDLYAVSRTSMWTDTSCFGLIKFIEHDYYVNFTNTGLLGTSQSHLFLETLASLSQCWYTYKDDYVSVHRSTPQLVEGAFNIIDGNGSPNQLSTFKVPGMTGDLGLKVANTNGIIYNSALKALSRLSKYVNKDSVIAQRISTWIRAHYGADVSNSVFEDSNHISSTRLDLEINDVLSTSDTATKTGGSMLGELAGKGLGFDKSGFSFHSPSFGYLYVLSSIVPSCGYFQGNASHLYALNFDTIPNADFDCLGYELTPKGMICGDNNILFNNTEKLRDKSFGYVPRYSMFKVNKNVVNGDMSRRGVNADMSPYYLDRVLVQNLLTLKSNVSGKITLDLIHKDLPCASEEWRYCCKHPYLGDPHRIFQFDVGEESSGASILYDDSQNDINDHFVCQTIFDVKYKCMLKPLSDSFDTFDDTDTNTMSVAAE